MKASETLAQGRSSPMGLYPLLLAVFLMVSAASGFLLLLTLHWGGLLNVVVFASTSGGFDKPFFWLTGLGTWVICAAVLLVGPFSKHALGAISARCMGAKSGPRKRLSGVVLRPPGSNRAEGEPNQTVKHPEEAKGGWQVRMATAIALVVSVLVFSFVVALWTRVKPLTPAMKYGILAIALWALIAAFSHWFVDRIVAYVVRRAEPHSPKSLHKRLSLKVRVAISMFVYAGLAIAFWLPMNWWFLALWMV